MFVFVRSILDRGGGLRRKKRRRTMRTVEKEKED